MNEITPNTFLKVALPLAAINIAAEGEKSLCHGDSSTLYLKFFLKAESR
jgi:hypothetical protein